MRSPFRSSPLDLSSRDSEPEPRRVRRLSVRGPLFVGYLIIVVFFFGGLGWAAVAPVTKGATVAGSLITESKTKATRALPRQQGQRAIEPAIW